MQADPTLDSWRMTQPFQKTFTVRNYNLDATLSSGQAFRWSLGPSGWTGAVCERWVRLKASESAIFAETTTHPGDWRWLSHYLQLDVNLEAVVGSFPDHSAMRAAVRGCPGLRLLRQDPWQCLASFILSSTKQIVQIQQIIALLADRYGQPLATPPDCLPAHSFPTAARIASLTEPELRDCKMGFRAPYLLATARQVTQGFNLEVLQDLSLLAARERLMSLPGVGRKIADCVLLFAYGFQDAFPIDVWLLKALRQLFCPRRSMPLNRLHRFVERNFGPHAGFAQQYLFHYVRTHPDAFSGSGKRTVALRKQRTVKQIT
jgi:N-glycosylase/DNA lyase